MQASRWFLLSKDRRLAVSFVGEAACAIKLDANARQIRPFPKAEVTMVFLTVVPLLPLLTAFPNRQFARGRSQYKPKSDLLVDQPSTQRWAFLLKGRDVLMLPCCLSIASAADRTDLGYRRRSRQPCRRQDRCLAQRFCCAITTLYMVATQGPIAIRFYDPTAALYVPIPFGFYIDRLSAVMMVLISAIGTIIYIY